MELQTFEHSPLLGWSAPLSSELDSPRTLVLAFGASALIDDPAALSKLHQTFPNACVVGCSTAGEIAGTRILDGAISVAVAKFASSDLRIASAPLAGSDAS